MDCEAIYGNPLLVDVDLEVYSSSYALEGGEDENDGVAEAKEDSRVSNLGD